MCHRNTIYLEIIFVRNVCTQSTPSGSFGPFHPHQNIDVADLHGAILKSCHSRPEISDILYMQYLTPKYELYSYILYKQYLCTYLHLIMLMPNICY